MDTEIQAMLLKVALDEEETAYAHILKQLAQEEAKQLAALKESLASIQKAVEQSKSEKDITYLTVFLKAERGKELSIVEDLERRLDEALVALSADFAGRSKELKDDSSLKFLMKYLRDKRNTLIYYLAKGGELEHKISRYKLFLPRILRAYRWNSLEWAFRRAGNELRSLIEFLEVLERLKPLKAKKGLIVEGVLIPSAYQPLSEWQSAHLGQEPDKKSLRYLAHKHVFVFDASNVEYLAFLQQCKDDTKTLAAALQAIGHLYDDSVLFKGHMKTRDGKWKKNIRFIIAPPFFSSAEEEKGNLRMQWSQSGDEFMLHFDENHQLQRVRWFGSTIYYGDKFKQRLSRLISVSSVDLALAYGDWPTFASILIKCLQAYHEW
ncbi:hypothetical protein HYX12_01585 [Candidatus Woesearchaeota archaeon]|nr:hypothetical protein [Candidatus Woesearchaeota archaeon]